MATDRFWKLAVAQCVLIVLVACQPLATPEPLATPTPIPSPTITLTPAPRTAEVSELVKEVTARTGAEAVWASASEGQQIPENGGVRTGDESRARVDISDGAILRLAANTEFTLIQISPEPTDSFTRFVLQAGKVWTFVAETLGLGSFEIETPSGVSTVRGSWMSVHYFPENGHMIVACLEGQCRLTSTTGAFTDLITGQQSEIPGTGQDPTPAQPIDPAQLADWLANVPEARTVAATITPGPPPTATPTLTPTPTATPTLTPEQLLATFPLQATDAPSGTLFSQTSSGARTTDNYRLLFGADVSVSRAQALGFQSAYVTVFDPAQPPCQQYCEVISWAAAFETEDGASQYLQGQINAFGSYTPVEGLGDEAFVWVYQLREGAGRDFYTYQWRSGQVVLYLSVTTVGDAVPEADLRALADLMQSRVR